MKKKPKCFVVLEKPGGYIIPNRKYTGGAIHGGWMLGGSGAKRRGGEPMSQGK